MELKNRRREAATELRRHVEALNFDLPRAGNWWRRRRCSRWRSSCPAGRSSGFSGWRCGPVWRQERRRGSHSPLRRQNDMAAWIGCCVGVRPRGRCNSRARRNRPRKNQRRKTGFIIIAAEFLRAIIGACKNTDFALFIQLANARLQRRQIHDQQYAERA